MSVTTERTSSCSYALRRNAQSSNGSVKPRLVLESVPWVNLVAIDTQGRSIMVRQHRFGVGYKTLETPGRDG